MIVMVDDHSDRPHSAESVQPDESDPGWRDVKHDTTSLDCMSTDAQAHLACIWPEHCDCPCHDVCTCTSTDGAHDPAQCHVGRGALPASTPEEGQLAETIAGPMRGFSSHWGDLNADDCAYLARVILQAGYRLPPGSPEARPGRPATTRSASASPRT